jgi:hypothetical protein
LALNAFLVIFGIVILDEVIEFVGLCPMARSAVGSLIARLVLVVREDLCKTAALSAAVFISMAPFETLELGLKQPVSSRHRL